MPAQPGDEGIRHDDRIGVETGGGDELFEPRRSHIPGRDLATLDGGPEGAVDLVVGGEVTVRLLDAGETERVLERQRLRKVGVEQSVVEVEQERRVRHDGRGLQNRQRVAHVENSSSRSTMPNARSGTTSMTR